MIGDIPLYQGLASHLMRGYAVPATFEADNVVATL